MSSRIPRRRRIGSFKHKKGNTPYKWYNPEAYAKEQREIWAREEKRRRGFFPPIDEQHSLDVRMDREDEIDGRWIDAVEEYAQTCDGCNELTMNELMIMDEKTQLSYCYECRTA